MSDKSRFPARENASVRRVGGDGDGIDSRPAEEGDASDGADIYEPAVPPDRGALEQDVRAELREIAAVAMPLDLAEQIILRALEVRATDVHIDPWGGRHEVRFRIDGRLMSILDLDHRIGQPTVRGIKVAAQMNIVDHRMPQDGSMAVRYRGRVFNVRVASLPTSDGERIVMRIFEPFSDRFNIDHLGLEPEQHAMLDRFLSRPYGALVVSGPSGAGKTTMLYSCLKRVRDTSCNLMTIEDPVENRFEGVSQVEIDAKVGLNFAKGLRAILRQDPDVLMIGEIRDEETAAIGIRAALTGVLVFSTIHASEAVGTITTLANYGVPASTLAGALQGVVNQRLVRKICERCRESYRPDASAFEILRLDPEEHADLTLYRGTGCLACFQTGYYGRTGVFEVMDVTEAIRDLIHSRASREEIQRAARAAGMKTLHESALAKVLRGETTIEEMHRLMI